MPSRARPKRLCVFGDSHIGCVKMALTEALFLPPKGVEIEFWGAEGPMFRQLAYTDGKVLPSDEALPVVRAVNGQGRDVLDPDNYDAMLFMGARIRSLNIFEPVLMRLRQPDGFLSRAVFFQNCADWLRRQKFYVVARDFARSSRCQVILAPSTFLVEGAVGYKGAEVADCQMPNPEGVARIWTALEQAAVEDGITLIRQPPETCGDGCTSNPEYSRRNADNSIDPTHRNPAYGALILKRTMAALA